MDDTFPRYKERATEATLFISINVLKVYAVARHSALEGHTTVTARALPVLVAFVLQRLAILAKEAKTPLDPTVLEDLIESFSFNKIIKRFLAARLCIVLCDMNSDKSTLLEIGGIIQPLEGHTIYVTFAPTADDTARTSLPKDIRLAFNTHKKLFFHGGLTLHIASSIPTPTGFIFQATILTLLSLEQEDKVPTPSKRSRQGSDILAGIPPQGHAPWLHAHINKAPVDNNNGTCDLPWLTPSRTPEGKSISWTSSTNGLAVAANETLSFCPGSILNGEVQPFLVSPTLHNSRLCTSIYVSISNPRVFHMALDTSSDTGKKIGLHTFPRAILRQLEA
jgi:hypothetical protein